MDFNVSLFLDNLLGHTIDFYNFFKKIQKHRGVEFLLYVYVYIYIYIYIVIDEDFGSVCWRHYLLEVHLFTTINDLTY